MKPMIVALAVLLPGMASASLGPGPTQTQTDISGSHIVQMAYLTPGGAPTPDCTEPVPVAETVLYACTVFPDVE